MHLRFSNHRCARPAWQLERSLGERPQVLPGLGSSRAKDGAKHLACAFAAYQPYVAVVVADVETWRRAARIAATARRAARNIFRSPRGFASCRSRMRSDGTPKGGAEGDRTPDLMTASHALSQLSYGPWGRRSLARHGPDGEPFFAASCSRCRRRALGCGRMAVLPTVDPECPVSAPAEPRWSTPMELG